MLRERIYWMIVSLLLVSCQSAAPPPTPTATALPTLAAVAPTLTATTTATVPATWTPAPVTVELAELDAWQTFTPRPTASPWPTNTPTHTPTPSITPTFTPRPTSTPNQANRLRNGSFERGWYHLNGDPELQIPEFWEFEYEEGENELDSDPWNRWVQPEVRVLSPTFLPEDEHDLFIWDGEQTLKIFKRQGAINVRLLTSLYLEPGSYTLTINVFPDLIESYSIWGGKRWASDELSGEVGFIVDGRQSAWELPAFGVKNTLTHNFVVDEGHIVRLGVAFRGRWAIENNGWFMDDWELRRTN